MILTRGVGWEEEVLEDEVEDGEDGGDGFGGWGTWGTLRRAAPRVMRGTGTEGGLREYDSLTVGSARWLAAAVRW